MNRRLEPVLTGRKLSLIAGLLLAMLLLVLPATSAVNAQGDGKAKLAGDVSEALRGAAGDDLVPVIVQTVDEPSDAHFGRLHGRGGVVKTRHASIRGYSARVPASQLEAFADDPEIEHISIDEPVKARMDVAYPAVKADLAYQEFGVTGSGIGVAVIDTGVAAHPDLMKGPGNRQVVEVEIVGKEPGLADYYGHGTHVAGIIAGSGASSTGRPFYRTFKGIAPGVQLLSVRALAPDGSGYTSDILAGLDWVIRNKSVYNIRVVNMSLGHPVFESYTTDPLCRAVRAANDAGLVVVAAAGNGGRLGTGFGTIDTPGNEPSVITVGALDNMHTVTTSDDTLAPYSSKGPSLVDFVVKPDLVAPGSSIVSLRDPGSYLDVNYHYLTLKVGDYKYDTLNALNDGAYYTLSGTSMAAPMVSAAAALMLQNEPGLNPATVKARLMASAVPDSRTIFETGAGYLDVEAALKAKGYAKVANSPLAIPGNDGYVYIQDLSLIWGSDWTQAGVWHGKCVTDSVAMSSVLDAATYSALSAIWGGGGGGRGSKATSLSLVWNNSVTADSLVWGGLGALSGMTNGSVTNEAAVWGHGGGGNGH